MPPPPLPVGFAFAFEARLMMVQSWGSDNFFTLSRMRPHCRLSVLQTTNTCGPLTLVLLASCEATDFLTLCIGRALQKALNPSRQHIPLTEAPLFETQQQRVLCFVRATCISWCPWSLWVSLSVSECLWVSLSVYGLPCWGMWVSWASLGTSGRLYI